MTIEPANLKDLVTSVSKDTGLTRDQVTRCIRSLVADIETRLTDGQGVKMVGFLHLDTAVRPPRNARNPRTNAVVPVPATRAVTFRAGKRLKESVKNRQADLAVS